MADEIELVRHFRSDVPEPSPEVRARAWSVVKAAAEKGALGSVPPSPRRPLPIGGRPMVALAAVLVVAAVVTSLVLTANQGAGLGGFTTTWQPARPASHAVATGKAGNTQGVMRLVSYIEGPRWREGKNQVPPGYLDCPASDACYLLAQTALSTQEPYTGPYVNYYNSVYFSGDGGATWSSLALPPRLELTAPLSCPTAVTCVGVGYQGDKNELVATSDGGHRWLVRPLLAPADVMSLNCSSVSACNFVTEATYPSPGQPQQFASTVDGGATWYTHSFDGNLDISSFSCPTATECMAVASPIGNPVPAEPKASAGLALVTTNSGRVWSRSPLPGTASSLLAPEGLGDKGLLSCADASNCLVFGGSTIDFEVQGAVPSHCPLGGCVLDEKVTWHAQVASTSDGGQTWQVHILPAIYIGSYPRKYDAGQPGDSTHSSYPSPAEGPEFAPSDLSCPQAGDCWLASQIGLLQTPDRGSHWVREPISKQLGVLQVSCPQRDECVALGATTSDLSGVPVFSNIANAP